MLKGISKMICKKTSTLVMQMTPKPLNPQPSHGFPSTSPSTPPSHLASRRLNQLQSRWKRAFRHPPRSRRDLSACGDWVATTFTTTCKVSCTFTFTGSAGSLTVTMPGESHFSDFIPFLQGSHARSFCECVYSSHETLSQEGQCA